MIPVDKKIEYEGNIDFSKQIGFFISPNKFMFTTLRKGIYSDCIDSTVREVISNAIDAQAKNNSDNPLEIFLNEQLVVEDKGTGITPEKMREVIAGYGESDKRESNDEIGAFGLGFKSPFSIADQFVIRTIYEKEGKNYLTNYVCSLDDKGGGIYPLNDPIKINEPTGTTIKIPISSNDYHKVKTAVNKYCNFLKPRPKVYFNDDSIFNPPEIEEETELWVRYKLNMPYNVLYNGIPYNIRYIYSYSNIPGLMIKFKIGEIELPASREKIIETDDFIKKSEERVEDYKSTIKDRVTKELAQVQDIKELIKLLDQNKQNHFFLNLNDIKYNDIAINLDNIYSIIKNDSHHKRTAFYGYRRINYKDLLDCDILEFENKDKLDDKGYHKIKIGYYVKNVKSKLLINFIDNPNPVLELLPDRKITLKDIKLPKPPKREKVEKKTIYRIKTKRWGRDKFDNKDIYKENFVYSTTIIPEPEWGYVACEVNENSGFHRRIKKLPNWISTNDLLHQKLKEVSLTKEQLEELAGKSVFCDEKIEKLVNFADSNRLLSYTNVENERKKFFKKYPLLGCIGLTNLKKQNQHVLNYIKLIDSQEKV